MWDTIPELEYRARANIEGAQQELNMRLTDRMELPLLALNGEKLYLTGLAALRKKAAELDTLYERAPARRGVKDTILLDAWSSAAIEGARTVLNLLVMKGHLTVETNKAPYIYHLHQHILCN